MSEEIMKIWADKAKEALIGKRIVHVMYMDEGMKEQLGWYHSAVVILLDDGTSIFPSEDDEGNGAGALFTNLEDLHTLPVI